MDTPTTDQAATVTRRALLIGVDGYQFVRPLRGCVNDILAVRDFLVNKAGFPAANVRLLLAPPAGTVLPATLGPVERPTRDTIRRAFQELAAASQPNDQIVVYYSGHGTQIVNPQNSKEKIGAIVPVDAQANGTNFYVNRELNESIGRVVGAGAVVTAVVDACHSGGIARGDLGDGSAGDGPAVREITLDLTPEAWATLQADSGVTAADLTGESDSRDIGGSGWVPSITQAQDLVILAGCRDTETSQEYVPPGSALRQGALTYFLLDSLRSITPDQVTQLRWGDIYPKISSNVNAAFAIQHPTLEGRFERPVFGGTWKPFDPGFTATPGPGGTLTLDGGSIQGLDVGAVVDLYPSDTADFAAAEQAGKKLGSATINTATAVSSTATGGPASAATGARARLVQPSPRQRPLGVKLTGLPADIAAALTGDAEAQKFLNFAPAGTPDVEVRAWQHDGRLAWAIVPFTLTQQPVDPNTLIGYLDTVAGDKPAVLGSKLAGGLCQWARYWSVLTRRNDDPTLQGAINVVLLAGQDVAAMTANPNNPQVARPLTPNAAGQYTVSETEAILLKVAVNGTRRLFVGVLVCSDEGNIFALWPPPNADNVVPPGEEKIVGLSGPNPFGLPVGTNPPQTTSLYTFKVFASDDQHPINIHSMAQDMTVQEILDGRGNPTAIPPPTTLWTTLELPLLVRK